MRLATAVGAAALALVARAPAARALSSWYTAPGGTPAGSTTGDKIRGVNVGGLFILENWMMPSFFQVAPLDEATVPDEWTFCSVLGQAECLARLEQHWDTYLTEQDFQRFANYSLNAIRIPMGYWAWTDVLDYEPYIQGQLPYLERALNWSSTYGLDVMMDLHGLPGGQNGQDNQGVKGPIEFQANATNMDRAMSALANMTAFVTADRFNGVVKAIELTNEPYILEYNAAGMDFDTLADFYVKGYATVRANEYIQPGGHEVMVVIHDAFQPLANWNYFWSQASLGLNWTNYALDTHIYDAFNGASGKTAQEHLDTICAQASLISAAQAQFPVIVGEFSLGTNTYCVDYQSCWGLALADTMANLTSYEASLFLRQFWEVQADVYELGAGWIFWSHANALGAPWSWTQSAMQNWVPEDPTEKVWPFDSGASSGCLDIASPIDGDQNMPAFPSYAAPIRNVTLVATGSGNATSVGAAAANATSSAGAGTSASASSTDSRTSAAAAASSATSSARQRATPAGAAAAGLPLLVAVVAGYAAIA